LRLLLTSAGVKNTSIHNALVDLLGKPIADSSALCIPTAMHGHPHVGPGEGPWRLSVADPTIPCASWDGSPWECGLADLLPSLSEMVWVGLSGGSMVMTPRIGDDFVGWKPPTSGDETLGVVDFPICPHVNPEPECRPPR
jgi:dipeptidase E